MMRRMQLKLWKHPSFHYESFPPSLWFDKLPSTTLSFLPLHTHSVYLTLYFHYTVCPTRYRTWHFFNNFTTNEIAGGPLLRVATIRRTTDTFLFISHTKNVHLFKFRCNIFMPGSVARGTPCINLNMCSHKVQAPSKESSRASFTAKYNCYFAIIAATCFDPSVNRQALT